MSEIDRYKKYYYIATYLIAVIAIIGFVFSVYASYQNGKQINRFSKMLAGMESNMERLERNLSRANEPLLKLDGYSWRLLDSKKELSCNNPPIAIKLSYRNVSKVVLRVVDFKILIKYGQLTLPVTTEIKFNEAILPPNDSLYYTYTGNDEMVKYSSTSKDSGRDPLFSVESKVFFTDSAGAKKYIYEAIHKLPFSCSEKIKSVKFDNYGYSGFRTEKEVCIPNGSSGSQETAPPEP